MKSIGSIGNDMVPTRKERETKKSPGCITPRSSVRIHCSPLKPRCRNNFDPGVFSCAAGETWRNDPLHPKSPQQLAMTPGSGRRSGSKNRDTAWRPNSGQSDSKIALCLSKIQRHSLWVKTLVGLSRSQSTVWVRFGEDCGKRPGGRVRLRH